MIGISRVSGRPELTVVHSKPGSSSHDELHPSPSRRLPSSHSSVGNFTPSPQTAVHTPPAHFGSISHVGEHPSYGRVLPSSHCSVPSFLPSPHVVLLHDVAGGHFQPFSSVHVAEQPSPSAGGFPSSHSSSPATMPSPHSAAWQAAPGKGQVQPGSS